MSTRSSGTTGPAIVGRPAWIADIVAVWGEPRVKVEQPSTLIRERGALFRRCWVWFPGASNHNVHLDQYADHFELGVECHCDHQDVIVRSKVAPDDAAGRAALATAGWDLAAASTLEGAA